MTAALPQPLRFQVGARTLLAVRRRLVRIGLSLGDALGDKAVILPPLAPGDHGYLVTSLPVSRRDAVEAQMPGALPLERQRYARRYADLSASFDDYMATFSGKSRSTLRRKVRKFEKLSGGMLDLRCYRTLGEMSEFYDLARQVSEKTYQERLLDAGLPDGADAQAEMRRLAGRDELRAWLLFVDGEPVSYLYAPADGDTLIYAYLGYDPAFAKYSPGAVLQIEAMRQVIEEGRFRRFDFTEGDGQHKRQFATGSVDCVDLLLLKPTFGHRALIASLKGFDGSMALAKRGVKALRLERVAKTIRR
ncbi:MAG: GNAT family N-acetyltransferase [Parasphingopyxis sp.]|uniref:GNAT family N-acetyltransferase n=1 Tax=Parasphingopyxis sp. TaxID=1920299 RepID=UPI002633A160|nr:GNAT family N-acetyltransferase [uncultured Parasphingopyxis sp.]